MEIRIFNPDNNKLISIDEWRKESDPTRAQLLTIETEDGHLLCMSKSYLPGDYTFEEAQKACAEFKPLHGVTFRCPTRKECIDIYDAHFQGLDEAIELIGGDYVKRGCYHWTGDRDAGPNYVANYAWFSIGINGFLYNYFMYYTYPALPVAII